MRMRGWGNSWAQAGLAPAAEGSPSSLESLEDPPPAPPPSEEEVSEEEEEEKSEVNIHKINR